MKNLLWTVSGDYTLDVKLDLKSYKKSKYITMYDAVKQGAFAKYFDMEVLSMYIVKKIYLQAQQAPLMELAQLCVDAAAYPHINRERSGVSEIRKRAFQDMLEFQSARMSASFFGQVRFYILRNFLRSGNDLATERIQSVINRIQSLQKAENTMDIIRTIDQVYNRIIDRTFEEKYGTLEEVLAVSLEELQEFNWQDYLDEESLQEVLKQYMNSLASSDIDKVDMKDRPKREPSSGGQRVRILDDEALKKVYDYVELNHGISYLSMREQEAVNYQLCRGAHEDCSLYYTDGILHNHAKINYQYKYAQMQLSKNKQYYHANHRIIKRNIAMLTEMLRKSLVIRNEDDACKGSSGVLVPSRLWKLGRTDDTKLFDKIIKKDTSDFVVDILIDSSGSQSSRQAQVAAQGYIISEALSNIGIPHQVVGFCTFWDYTVMHRFRSYDDDRNMNQRIFEFMASSNNRDGLAIRATYDRLMKREELNKVLIVLSDGRPNDQKVNRPGSRNPRLYEGEFAVRDTAFEVRRARALGISVLGVFAGEDEDLNAEKKIFGKDFAFIRHIGNFSNIVGTYLKRQIEEDM
ncbi:MAG: VWA domain-containing protein [Lachnospiraceae bacterium]|nr:VWA domain-containing protein [Lachnospiraceae bacterium]